MGCTAQKKIYAFAGMKKKDDKKDFRFLGNDKQKEGGGAALCKSY